MDCFVEPAQFGQRGVDVTAFHAGEQFAVSGDEMRDLIDVFARAIAHQNRVGERGLVDAEPQARKMARLEIDLSAAEPLCGGWRSRGSSGIELSSARGYPRGFGPVAQPDRATVS